MLNSSFLLYLFIIVITTFFARLSQQQGRNGRIEFKRFFFFAAFFIHWFFLCFTRTGADHESYQIIIERDALVYFDKGLEVGFNGLCILLYNWLGDSEKCIFIIKTISVVLFYLSFYMMRNYTKLWMVILAYNVWSYFYSIFIIAHAIAIALIMIGAVMIMMEKKWYYPILLSILAFSIHASALIFLLVFVAIEVMNRMKIRAGRVFVLLALLGSIVILSNLNEVFNFAITRVDSFLQYENGVVVSSESGIFNYVLFLYIFVFLILPILKSNSPIAIRNASFIFFIFGFVSAIMGYFLPTARMNQYTLVLYAIVIPWYFHELRFTIEKESQKENILFSQVIWIAVLLFFGYGTLMTITNPSSSTELFNYEFFNPFS